MLRVLSILTAGSTNGIYQYSYGVEMPTGLITLICRSSYCLAADGLSMNIRRCFRPGGYLQYLPCCCLSQFFFVQYFDKLFQMQVPALQARIAILLSLRCPPLSFPRSPSVPILIAKWRLYSATDTTQFLHFLTASALWIKPRLKKNTTRNYNKINLFA